MAIKSIWVPTDFSNCAQGAITYAAHVAKATNGNINIVHCYTRPISTYPTYDSIVIIDDPVLDKQLRDALTEKLVSLEKRAILKNIKTSSELISDKTVWQFFHKVKPDAIDLIVMGTTGHTGLLHGGLLGTNTERTVRLANVPVLVIPEGSVFKTPKTILFPTDFGPEMKKTYVLVRDFAKLWNAKIVICSINTPESYTTHADAEKKFELLRRIAPYKNIEWAMYNAFSVADGISKLSNIHKPEIVAMFTHGRTGLTHMLFGSVAETTSATINLPMLLVKGETPRVTAK